MKVKLRISRAGVGFTQDEGETIEVSAKEGARLIAAGKATACRGTKAPRTAMKRDTSEKATK